MKKTTVRLIRVHTYTYMYAYVRTYKTYIHTLSTVRWPLCWYAYIRMYVYTYVRTYIQRHTHAYLVYSKVALMLVCLHQERTHSQKSVPEHIYYKKLFTERGLLRIEKKNSLQRENRGLVSSENEPLHIYNTKLITFRGLWGCRHKFSNRDCALVYLQYKTHYIWRTFEVTGINSQTPAP
jgi:hypothetical protein